LPYPENIRELSDLFPILWEQILQKEIDNLIRRIIRVIRVRGRNTDYLKLKQTLFNFILFNFKGFTFFFVPFCIDLAENEWNYTYVSIMIPVLPFLFTNSI
jgi:hypothetical protein